jgi:hypothetical protein
MAPIASDSAKPTSPLLRAPKTHPSWKSMRSCEVLLAARAPLQLRLYTWVILEDDPEHYVLALVASSKPQILY